MLPDCPPILGSGIVTGFEIFLDDRIGRGTIISDGNDDGVEYFNGSLQASRWPHFFILSCRIIWSFTRYRHIMDMTFLKSSIGDTHKLGALTQIPERL